MTPISDELIETMTEAIVREVRPLSIILFGSWARGDGAGDADIDLLVIEREPFGPGRSRRHEAARIWRCLSPFRLPKDILVYSADEVQHWRQSANHVIARALEEGKILYESA